MMVAYPEVAPGGQVSAARELNLRPLYLLSKNSLQGYEATAHIYGSLR